MLRLQQYDDGTFGYLGIDGDEHHKFQNDANVVCTQNENEDRDEFIIKNNIIFTNNQYGSNEQLDRKINDSEPDTRIEVAKIGYGLDKLMYDEDYEVKIEVVIQDYRLDILVNDPDVNVRLAIAKCGRCLDILVNDRVPAIRIEVARHGYGLDQLINDEISDIRQEVARHGYGLNILINDKSAWVRMEVIKQGYGIETLINDRESVVRISAKHYFNTASNIEKLDIANKCYDKYKLNIDNLSEDGKANIKSIYRYLYNQNKYTEELSKLLQ